MSSAAIASPPTMSPRTRAALTALWILGVVATVGAAIALVWAMSRFNSTSGSEGPTQDLAVAQVLYALCPGVLAGGLMCVGLALAVTAGRGVLSDLRDSSLSRLDDTVVSDPGDAFDRSADDRSRATEAHTAIAHPIDPDAFKRPRADEHAPS